MRLTVIFVAALLAAPLATAQTPQPQPLAAVFVCADVVDNEARLRCYDDAVGLLRTADAEGRIVAVDRDQMAALERDSFGFNLPSMGALFSSRSSQNGAERIERIEAQVERVVRLANGRHRFVLSNGQSWVQIEARSATNVDPGDDIAIRRAALGSFMLSPEHGGAHRVRREQ